MGLAVIIAGTLAFVGVGAGFMIGKTNAASRRAQAWEQFARRRGGTQYPLHPHMQEWGPVNGVELVVGGVVVRLDVHHELLQGEKHAYTRVRAHYALGAGPAFHVSPVSALSALGRAVGVQDIKLGHAGFDDAFIVKGEDPAGIGAVWQPATQARVHERLRDVTIVSHGKMVTLHAERQRTLGLDDMVDVVAALASAEAQVLEPFSALPGAELVPIGGTWQAPTLPHVVIPSARGNAVVEATAHEGGARVSLRLPLSRPLPDFRVAIDGERVDGLPAGLLTDAGAPALSKLSESVAVSEDGQLTLEWVAVPTSEELATGLVLLVDLAGGAYRTGAFR